MLAENVNKNDPNMILPTGDIAKKLRSSGLVLIAGVDEAGAGALAGPVVAGAVILPANHGLAVRDSKLMTAKARDRMFDEIHLAAISIGIGIVDATVIDEINIREASLLAMEKAVSELEEVEHVLVDAHTINIDFPQTAIIKGDQKEFCIAAASIIAKVTRDRMMLKLETEFPQYGFAKHKGYGTVQHRQAVADHGRISAHRASFTISI
jgi:ribonuclease HII